MEVKQLPNEYSLMDSKLDFNTQLQDALKCIDSISLKELDAVALLDRQDTKYIIHQKHLASFLMEVKDLYRVLTIDERKIFNYDTLYYDTKDFTLYKHHHNGKINRVKVRFRKYVESTLTFFEVKYKIYGTRTVKERSKELDITNNLSPEQRQMIKEVHFNRNDLVSQLWVYYKRITLVNKDLSERVTIDLDLRFKHGESMRSVENMVIIEIKQNRKSVLMPFIQLMKRHLITPVSISKYCLGVVLTVPNIKYNLFKPKFKRIEKIIETPLLHT